MGGIKATATNEYSSKTASIPVLSPKIVKGYWTDIDDKMLTKAFLGETVRFHIETRDISDGKTIDTVIYDDDGLLNPDDKIASNKIAIKDNKGYVEINLDENWSSYIDDDYGNEIELYCECKYKNLTKNLPGNSEDYLIVYEKGEIVTVIIELPHSSETDKLNAKGLAGHTGIIIDDDFYDFGPQPRRPFKSDGQPWWDSFYGDLNKQDILDILDDKRNRVSHGIRGKVYLIDICIRKSEFVKLKEWWVDRYANPGTYSIIPLIGEQCTTTVRISLEKSTGIFSFFDITGTTQTPKGFVELLTSKAKHTAGENVNKAVAVTKEYPELGEND